MASHHLITETQREFYRRWLMGRPVFDPKNYGIDSDRSAVVDQFCEDFNDKYHGMLSIDEVLLHPRTAMRFCDDVREKHGWFELPDEAILRSVLNRRKNPGG